jgi:type IV pilus assembly protein PilA
LPVRKVGQGGYEGTLYVSFRECPATEVQRFRRVHSGCFTATGESAMREPVMLKTRGFSLIELLIVVAIILIVAAIAVPSFLRSRIDANQSAAVGALRTVNTAQVAYNSVYPTVGYSGALASLGGSTCLPPNSTSACLIDANLAAGSRSGYIFTLSGSGTPVSGYNVIASPSTWNYTGINYYCSFEDAVIRVSTTAITVCNSSVPPQQ